MKRPSVFTRLPSSSPSQSLERAKEELLDVYRWQLVCEKITDIGLTFCAVIDDQRQCICLMFLILSILESLHPQLAQYHQRFKGGRKEKEEADNKPQTLLQLRLCLISFFSTKPRLTEYPQIYEPRACLSVIHI